MVTDSPALMTRCGMPLRPLATVPPAPPAPVMFSKVMARLSRIGDTLVSSLTVNIGIQILTESECFRPVRD